VPVVVDLVVVDVVAEEGDEVVEEGEEDRRSN
jgi:hypothetical protein